MTSNFVVLSTPDHIPGSVLAHAREELSSVEKDACTQIERQIDRYHRDLIEAKDRVWFDLLEPVTKWQDYDKQKQSAERLAEDWQKPTGILHNSQLCHFLPLWQNVLGECPLMLLYSPALVCAQSLQQNWRLPIVVGLAVWESYVINACKNLQNTKYLLLDATKLSDDDWRELGSRELPSQAQFASFEQFNGDLSEADLLQDAHHQLNDWLRAGNVDAIAEQSLSQASADLLRHYGRLRGALDIANQRAAKLTTQLNEMRTQADKAQESTEPSQDQSNFALSNEIEVCVQIRDLAPKTFVTQADSPVLSMLREQFIDQHSNQMIYLNVESEDQALYFMSSDLVGLDVNVR
ncbi:MAG: hypothetical protein AAF197_01210 [Pseudomonadota bacterium]